MQLMPETATFLAHRSGATTFTTADLDAEVNIAYGSYYLRYLLDEYHGNTVAGAGRLQRRRDQRRQLGRGRPTRDGRRFRVGDIPFPETRAYVQRVLQARAEYRHTYAAPARLRLSRGSDRGRVRPQRVDPVLAARR